MKMRVHYAIQKKVKVESQILARMILLIEILFVSENISSSSFQMPNSSNSSQHTTLSPDHHTTTIVEVETVKKKALRR